MATIQITEAISIDNKEKIAKELEKHLVILNSTDLNTAVERINYQIQTLLEEYQTLII